MAVNSEFLYEDDYSLIFSDDEDDIFVNVSIFKFVFHSYMIDVYMFCD